MRNIVIAVILLILISVGSANASLSAIVHNTSGATTGEDSLTLSFVCTDSIGNISGLDSIFVAIWDPLGDSVYAASYITTAAEIDSIDLGGNRTVWRWTEQIADIDAGGRIGTYTGLLIAIDTIDGTSADYLDQSTWFSFTLVNDPFSSMLDSSGLAALNSSKALDSLADVLDSLETMSTWIQDSLYAIIDTLQNYPARVDLVWDELLTGGTHNINNSSGKILRQIKGGSIIHDGTSDNVPANGANSISLESGGGSPTTSTIDNFYNHQRLAIVEGTGIGQVVMISDYVGSNQVATITPAFLTTPDGTSVYEILPGLVHAETQGGGYAMGAVWVSPTGTAGTQLYVNGTIDNPIDDGSFADAKTVADALNLNIFHLQSGSSVTLATTYNNYQFIGREWTLALGGQDISASTFTGAHSVTGIGTGANIIEFINCEIGPVELPPTEFFECGFGHDLAATDSLLATGAGQYVFRNCYSLVSGTLTPTFSMGDAIGNTKFGFRSYDGGMELSEIGSTGQDSISVEGFGNIILNSTNIGGVMVVRGLFDLTDNSSTTTITRTAALNGPYIADVVLDEVNTGATHNITSSLGKQIRELADVGVIRTNTAQAGTINTITLDAGASAMDGAYDPAGIFISSGTGAEQTRNILEYNGTTKIAVVNRSWKVNPDATSEFTIYPYAGNTHVNEGLAQAGAVGTITLNALASASNDYYIGQVVFIVSGTGDDQARRVTAYNGTTKIATITPNWITSPDATSGYLMKPYLLNRAEFAAENADSTWQRAFPVSGGTFEDSAKVWGATTAGSLDSAFFSRLVGRKVWGIPAGVGSDSTTRAQRLTTPWGTAVDATLKSLVISNSAGDAVQFTSTGGDGDGIQLTAHGLGWGGRFNGGATDGTGGLLLSSAATNGNGFRATGTGTGTGFRATGGATGVGVYIDAPANDAVQFIASSGNFDAFQLTGSGTGHGIFSTGGATGDGMNVIGGATSGRGLSIEANYKDTALVITAGDSSAVAVYIKGGDKAAGQEAYAFEVEAGDSTGGVRFKGGDLADASVAPEGIGFSVESGNPLTDVKRGMQIIGGLDGLIIAGALNNAGSDGLVINGYSSAIVLGNNASSSDPVVDYQAGAASVRHTDLVLDSANFSLQVYDSMGIQTEQAIVDASNVALQSDLLTEDSNIGIDWSDIQNPTAAVGLSATTVGGTSILGASAYTTIADTVLGRDTSDITTGFAQMMKDTSAYQGAAASLDSIAVYGAVEQAMADSLGVMGDTVNTILTADHGSGSWQASGAGSGPNVVTFYAIDTSGTDDTLQNVNVSIFTPSGSFVTGPLLTDVSGFVQFNLTADSFQVVAARIGYIFPVDTVVVTGVDTFNVTGYDIPVNLPSSSSLAQIVGDVTPIQGVSGMNAYGVQIVAYNENISLLKHGVDTVGGAKIVMPIAAMTTTDTTGHWVLNLIKSPNIGTDSTRGFYTIKGTFAGKEVFKYEHLFLTGNINLGDSLLSR